MNDDTRAKLDSFYQDTQQIAMMLVQMMNEHRGVKSGFQEAHRRLLVLTKRVEEAAKNAEPHA